MRHGGSNRVIKSVLTFRVQSIISTLYRSIGPLDWPLADYQAITEGYNLPSGVERQAAK